MKETNASIKINKRYKNITEVHNPKADCQLKVAEQPSFTSLRVSAFVKFNMASRKVLAPKLYKKFLQVCEQWPVDHNRLGRDLGEHLKGSLVPRIKKSEIGVSLVDVI